MTKEEKQEYVNKSLGHILACSPEIYEKICKSLREILEIDNEELERYIKNIPYENYF